MSKYRPPLFLLLESFRRSGRQYLEENQLHGFPYFVHRKRPKFERFAWLVLTILAALAAIIIMITIWSKFQTSPLLIEPEVAQIQTSYFPNVYLCFDWAKLNFSVLDENDTGILQTMYEWNWQSLNPAKMKDEKYLDAVDFRTIFHELTPDCGAIYTGCKFRNDLIDCGKIFKKSLTPVGACCVFASDVIEKSDVSWSLEFSPFEYPFRSYISATHDKEPMVGDLPLHTFENPATISLGLQITTTDDGVDQLELIKRKCTFDNESKSLVECERRCLIQRLVLECGCVSWFFENSAEKQCSLENYSCLAKAYANWDVSNCLCFIPCNEIAYDFNAIEESVEESVEKCSFQVKTWPDLVYERKIRFGWLDLACFFGGIAGSFLGYSLLSGVDLIYYFTMRAYCGAVLKNPRKVSKRMKIRHVAEKLDELEERLKYRYYAFTE